MSGVWVFRSNGVMRLVEKGGGGGRRKTLLIHVASGQAVCSYGILEKILEGLGWERYYEGENPHFIQFHKRSSIDLISLPIHFSSFNSIHMYDLVVKNPNVFHVTQP